jgi:cytochrome c biogenesis protein CcmG/thiol:disulfide interchange protein DsbE
MRRAPYTTVALLLVVSTVCTLTAVPAAAVDPVAPVDILRSAGRACDLTQGYTYNYTYRGTGGLKGLYRGSVRLLEGHDSVPSRVYIRTVVETEDGEREVVTVTDSQTTSVLDMQAKTLTVGTTAGGGSHLMFHLYFAVLFQFIQPGAFEFEIAKGEPVYDREAEVGGVDCHVVRVSNPFGAQVWWYFGKEDFFPRAQDWVDTRPDQEGEFEFRITELNFGAALTEADFVLEAPEGFEVIDDDARVVAPGAAAPAWSGQAREGDVLSGASTAGDVVVLDFWATWCPPCWQIMPAIERLAAEYAGQPVRFVGVNTWESSREKAESFLASKELTYPQILGGEDIASIFKVATLPGVIVIARDGTVTLVEAGGAGLSEDAIRSAVDEALAR